MPDPNTRPYSPVLARPTDPETSQAAADSVLDDGTVETHERRILAVLRDMPAGGTASEIAEAVRERWAISREIDFCKHTVCRRLAGLLSADLIHRCHDPHDHTRLYKRGGELVHWLGSGDTPLFPAWQPPKSPKQIANRESSESRESGAAK